MSVIASQSLTRNPAAKLALGRELLSFLIQVSLVAAVEVGDDFARGLIAQHDSHTGLANAGKVVAFEAAHGFWLEPGWQQFFLQSHQVFGQTISWSMVTPVVDSIYTLGHVLITFAFAL